MLSLSKKASLLLFVFVAFVVFAMSSDAVIAASVDNSPKNLWYVLTESYRTTALNVIARLLAQDSLVLNFARVVYLGTMVIMVAIYLLYFIWDGISSDSPVGPLKLGLFFVLAAVMLGLLYIPNVNSEGFGSVYLATLLYGLFVDTLDAGPRIFAVAAGLGDIDSNRAVEIIFKLAFRLKVDNLMPGIEGKIVAGIGSLLIGLTYVALSLVTFLYVSIMPVMMLFVLVAIIFLLPAALTPFGRQLTFSAFKALIGMILAYIMVWITLSFVMGSIDTYTTVTLTMEWLTANYIEIPIRGATDIGSAVTIPLIAILLFRSIPSVASAVVGTGSTIITR